MTDTRTETEKQLYALAQRWMRMESCSHEEALIAEQMAAIITEQFAPPKPRKEEAWVNVYEDGSRIYWTKRESADLYAQNRIACIYVSGEEGKGPSE